MRVSFWQLVIVAALMLSSSATQADPSPVPNLAPSAPGTKILDLAGTPISPANGAGINYTTSFVATSASSMVTFAFRDDAGYLGFANATAAASSNPANLFDNGSTSTDFGNNYGIGGWQVFTQAGVDPVGSVAQWGAFNIYVSSQFWAEGQSNGGYDGVSQSIATIAGETYQIGFDLVEQGSGASLYQPIMDAGGGAVDVAVFATNAAAPTDVPEPAAALLFGTAVAGLALVRRGGGRRASALLARAGKAR